MSPPLDQSYGYGIILVLGLCLGFVMTAITYVMKKYLDEDLESSENHMTANRSVKTGLVASAVVSSWTWAATLLQSSSVAFSYGISGPFWYASGATIQVLLFATIAIELKKVAPNAHTFMEVVRVRYGKEAHILYICYAFLTNMIVTAMLLLGGSATVEYLTGMDTNAACMLLPVGVIIYTSFGGIKATFLMDYMHTALIFIIILIFVFVCYGTSDKIGSIDKMYDLLKIASDKDPVIGNAGGQLATMASVEGIIFGIINIVGNFGTVFVDNAYWQRAIAAHPRYAVKAYLVGGLSWFAIPFTLATTMGLAGRALMLNLSKEDVGAGLVLPAAAFALMGKGGAFLSLLIIFMAVTSALSAELVAVSSIVTYDIYLSYVKPDANSQEVKRTADIFIVAFGLLSGILAIILKNIGINLGYLYLLMGILITSAVTPLTCALMWSKQNWYAVVISPVLGTIFAIIAWLVSAKVLNGEVTILTTGGNYPFLAGNLVALLIPIPIVYILTMLKPDKFDFATTKFEIKKVEDIELEVAVANHNDVVNLDDVEMTDAELDASSTFAKRSSLILTVILVIVWPLPLFFSDWVFNKEFFRGWVVFSIIWVWCSTIAVGIYPIYESAGAIQTVFANIMAGKANVDVMHHGIPTKDIQLDVSVTDAGLDASGNGTNQENDL